MTRWLLKVLAISSMCAGIGALLLVLPEPMAYRVLLSIGLGLLLAGPPPGWGDRWTGDR